MPRKGQFFFSVAGYFSVIVFLKLLPQLLVTEAKEEGCSLTGSEWHAFRHSLVSDWLFSGKGWLLANSVRSNRGSQRSKWLVCTLLVIHITIIFAKHLSSNPNAYKRSFTIHKVVRNLLITAISLGDPFGLNIWRRNRGKCPEHNWFSAAPICAILAFSNLKNAFIMLEYHTYLMSFRFNFGSCYDLWFKNK